MQLRNCILIALAFDASPDEIENAHNMIDRFYSGGAAAGGVEPKYLVGAEVPATSDGVTAHGQKITVGNDGVPNPDASVELDKNGLPWDERIHSGSRKKNADGSWSKRKNVDDATRSKVEAELRATMAGGTPAAAEPTPPPVAPAAPVAPPAAPTLAPPGNLPPIPGAAQPDPAYSSFVQFIAQNTHSDTNPAGRLTDEWVKTVLAHYGVAEGSLQNLAHNPALIPQIESYIRSQLGA